MSDEKEIEIENNHLFSQPRKPKKIQVKLKEKQRALRTESHLRARGEAEGERGKQYLFHFAYSGSLFQKFTIISIQQIFLPLQFHHLLGKIFQKSSETFQK